ncbi:MAG: M20/M25/M40 family metallo-hydrolase [Candidatus Cloacimonetes bacterium]|nr:M20/M25/M40 family metallo-hydrolase [Candidatus Cloacimonadota bacterium]
MKETLVEYFISLITIDSESKDEKAIAMKIADDLKSLGAEISFDNANEKIGSNVGNLYAYLSGDINKEPILFCTHLDTVVPGKGIKPIVKDDRIITDGTTILGADDKSGIAEVIWAVKQIKSANEKHAPIELLFTISEEIGLLGAKNIDHSKLKSKFGYALDSHEVGQLTIGAPSQNSMKFTIHGKESHAGGEPELGISAIQIAADAISKMKLGRIDDETTCNVGIIKGGTATNIIPKEVFIKAEARSHDPIKLQNTTDNIKNAFIKSVQKFKLADFRARVDSDIKLEYSSFKLDKNDKCVQLAEKASEKLGLTTNTVIGGGGSDANILNAQGLKIAIAGTGMNSVHTVNEYIKLKDLENGYLWVTEVIREYSKV